MVKLYVDVMVKNIIVLSGPSYVFPPHTIKFTFKAYSLVGFKYNSRVECTKYIMFI